MNAMTAMTAMTAVLLLLLACSPKDDGASGTTGSASGTTGASGSVDDTGVDDTDADDTDVDGTTTGEWTGPCWEELDCGGECPSMTDVYDSCHAYGWIEDCQTYFAVMCQSDFAWSQYFYVDDELVCLIEGSDSEDFCNYSSMTIQIGTCPAQTTDCKPM